MLKVNEFILCNLEHYKQLQTFLWWRLAGGLTLHRMINNLNLTRNRNQAPVFHSNFSLTRAFLM